MVKRTDKEIEAASACLKRAMTTDHLLPTQAALIAGMLVAISWARGSKHGSTLQELIDGRNIEPRG